MRELALGVPDSEDQDEIKPLRRSCPTGIDESVPDVREWLKGKPWLVQQAFAVPGLGEVRLAANLSAGRGVCECEV